MKYLVLYQVGGVGRWFYDSAHDASEAALQRLHGEARTHPGRVYEMHPVHEHVLDVLELGVTP